MIYSQMPLSIYYSEVCDDSCGFATKCPYEYIILNTLLPQYIVTAKCYQYIILKTLLPQVCTNSCTLQPSVIINILFRIHYFLKCVLAVVVYSQVSLSIYYS